MFCHKRKVFDQLRKATSKEVAFTLIYKIGSFLFAGKSGKDGDDRGDQQHSSVHVEPDPQAVLHLAKMVAS